MTIKLTIPAYVYLLQCKSSGHYYYGSRTANIKANRLPADDLWAHYFSSSRQVRKMIKQYGVDHFVATVIYSDTDISSVYWKEQLLISEHVTDPMCLNKKYQDRTQGHTVFSTSGKEPWNKGLPSPTKGISRTPDTLQLMTQNRKGKNIGQIAWNKGLTLTDDQKKNMGSYWKGKPAHNRGISSPRLGIPLGPQEKVKCPHCESTGGPSGMKRWHFDNCKSKCQ